MTFANCRCSSPWYSRTSELISRSVMNCWFAGLPLASMASASGRKFYPLWSSSSGIRSIVWGFSSGVSLGSVIESSRFSHIAPSNIARFWDSDSLYGSFSSGWRRKSDRRGITCSLIYRMAWHISLPSFQFGTKQRPNTSVWNGIFLLLIKSKSIHTIQIGVSWRYLPFLQEYLCMAFSLYLERIIFN